MREVAISDLKVAAVGTSRQLREYMLDELRRAMGWELTFVARVDEDELTITDTSGPPEWLAPGTVVPVADTMC